MIEFVNVSKKYHYDATFAVKDFSLRTEKPVTTVLIDTQSGKTTLCKMLLGLEQPDFGEIRFNGNPVSEISARDKNFAYLPQNLLLFDKKTALYNVAYPLKIRGVGKTEAEKQARAALEKFFVPPEVKASELSFSQRLSVALARIYVRRPRLLILDDLLCACGSEKTRVEQFIEELGVETVQFTSDAQSAIGEVVLYFDGKEVFRGDKAQAAAQKANYLWLNDEGEDK